MRDARQPLTPIADLGTRVLARYRSRRGFLRPRVPLVLHRTGAPAQAARLPKHVCVAASHYRLAVQLHLSVLSGPSAARHRASPEFERRDAVLRTLMTLAAPAATARRAGTAASLPVSATASAPRWLPSAGSARAAGSSATNTVARQIALNGPNGSNGPDGRSGSNGRHGRIGQAGRDGQGGTKGSTRSAITTTVAHEHCRHLIEKPDTTHVGPGTRFGADLAIRESTLPRARTLAPDYVEPAGRASRRSATTRAHRTGVPAPCPPVLMSSPRSSPGRRRHERPSLYAQPATRSFAAPAATPAQAAPPEPRSTQLPAPPVQALPPAIDVGRLSEDVYQHIQRRIRIERERRGL
jgi:hypothetical protein